MTIRLALTTLLASAVGTAVAGAQDYGLAPNYGEIILDAGFQPDPHTVSLRSGGDIDAAQSIGADCTGFISDAPDYRVTYTGSGSLTISVLADADTTLVVSDGTGEWQCDDDSRGDLDPQIVLDQPQTGTIDIWVGTYGDSTRNDATLEISSGGGFIDPKDPEYGAGGSAIDPALTPNFGSIVLQSGFKPDPYLVPLVAGGDLFASDIAGPTCTGYISQAPDYVVDFTAGALPLTIAASSGFDTTLVISDPYGTVTCDDDTNGMNPSITFERAETGLYAIWVGSYDEGSSNAVLSVTELE